MRLIITVLLILLTVFTHGQKEPTAPILQQSEELRIQLMRTESEVYGDFHKLRTFNTDLFQSINSGDAPPYPSLKLLFDTLFIEANKAVGYRVDYDTIYWSLKKAMEGKSKIKLKGTTASLYQTFQAMPASLPAEQQVHRDTYFALRLAYQDSCRKYGVVRYDPQQYAEILTEKLIQWQDSLEEMGRIIARCKADLKQRFPTQKGREFFAAYAPVSQMELMIKNFESILNQFQNAISRFEEGNNQDFIYFGPQVRQRMEVAVNDDLIGQLIIQMKDCRNAESSYYKRE